MHKDIKPDQIVVGLGWVLMANKFRHQGLGVGANATRTSPPDIGWKRPSTILGPPSWSVYSHKIPHISGWTGSLGTGLPSASRGISRNGTSTASWLMQSLEELGHASWGTLENFCSFFHAFFHGWNPHINIHLKLRDVVAINKFDDKMILSRGRRNQEGSMTR